jgi:polyphenol oxidase
MNARVESPQGSFLTPDWGAPAHVHALTTLRGGGLSAGAYDSFNLAQHVGDVPENVRGNRALLRSAARLPAEPLWLEQVHGIAVHTHAGDFEASTGILPRADAAVAFEPGRVCAVMTADCLPVVFADRAGACVGVAHAGWRGLVGGVLEATVSSMRSPPAQIVAWLGPAIGPDAFEVGPEVRDAFLERHAGNEAGFARNAAGRYQADLYALARLALARIGVGAVTGGGRCTHRESTQFFSFRRDEGRTGRMATVAWLEPASAGAKPQGAMEGARAGAC